MAWRGKALEPVHSLESSPGTLNEGPEACGHQLLQPGEHMGCDQSVLIDTSLVTTLGHGAPVPYQATPLNTKYFY